jgi:hypothetical protein
MELMRKFYMATSSGTGGPSKEDLDNAEELKNIFASLNDNMTSAGGKLTDSLQRAVNSSKDLDEVGKRIAKGAIATLGVEIRKAAKDLGRTKDIALNINKEFVSSKKIQENLSKIASHQSIIENQILTIQLQKGKLTKKQEEYYNTILQTLKAQAAVEEKLKDYAEQRERSAGLIGKAFKDLNKIPILGSLVDAERVSNAISKKAQETGNRWQAAGAGVKATFASIKDNLSDPVVLVTGLIKGLTTLVKLAADYQSKQFEAAKDLGVSVERGQKLRNNFVDLARTNLGLAVTADQLQKSYAGVQDELGVIVKQSDEFNLTSALIERRTGASAANMAQLQFAAKSMNTSLAKAYTSIIGSAKAEGMRVGIVQSEKQILEGISQTSGTIYQNFNGNFKAIAAANVQAKALGTTLDKINATQDQFLDFESSIAKQFEAEVLTGKELDLTRARQLALNHDTKGLMLEINRLAGSSAEWNKMDTLTQQSKAEALGMSRDSINEMYMDQQKTALLGKAATADLQTQYDLLIKAGKTREEISQVLGKDATQSAYAASVSEQMAATMDSIKQSIGEMTQGLMPLIKGFAEFVSDADNLKGLFVAIVGVMGTMAGISIALKVSEQQILQTQIQQQAITAANTGLLLERLGVEEALIGAKQSEAVASVTAGSGYLGPGAIVVGLAAGAALAAITGIALSGGGSSTAPSTGIAPYNPGAATAGTVGGNTSNAPAQPQTITIYNTMDGEIITKKVIEKTPATFGKNSN